MLSAPWPRQVGTPHLRAGLRADVLGPDDLRARKRGPLDVGASPLRAEQIRRPWWRPLCFEALGRVRWELGDFTCTSRSAARRGPDPFQLLRGQDIGTAFLNRFAAASSGRPSIAAQVAPRSRVVGGNRTFDPPGFCQQAVVAAEARRDLDAAAGNREFAAIGSGKRDARTVYVDLRAMMMSKQALNLQSIDVRCKRGARIRVHFLCLEQGIGAQDSLYQHFFADAHTVRQTTPRWKVNGELADAQTLPVEAGDGADQAGGGIAWRARNTQGDDRSVRQAVPADRQVIAERDSCLRVACQTHVLAKNDERAGSRIELLHRALHGVENRNLGGMVAPGAQHRP